MELFSKLKNCTEVMGIKVARKKLLRFPFFPPTSVPTCGSQGLLDAFRRVGGGGGLWGGFLKKIFSKVSRPRSGVANIFAGAGQRIIFGKNSFACGNLSVLAPYFLLFH
jgi:hypothetical protein